MKQEPCNRYPRCVPFLNSNIIPVRLPQATCRRSRRFRSNKSDNNKADSQTVTLAAGLGASVIDPPHPKDQGSICCLNVGNRSLRTMTRRRRRSRRRTRTVTATAVFAPTYLWTRSNQLSKQSATPAVAPRVIWYASAPPVSHPSTGSRARAYSGGNFS